MSKKYFALGLLPVMGLMMMSPSAIRLNKINSRSIAGTESSLSDIQRERQRIHEQALHMKSADADKVEIEPAVEAKVQEVKPEFPRIQAIVEKYEKENPHQKNESLNRGIYLNNLRGFASMVDNEVEHFSDRSDSKEKVADLKNQLKGLAEALGQSEKDLKDLQDGKVILENDEEKPQDILKTAKTKLEDLLKRTDDAAIAFDKPAASSEVVAEAKPEKPEEVKADENKPQDKDDKEEKVVRHTRPHRPASEKKEDKDENCQHENNAVAAALQKFIEEQSNVMKQMLTMMQGMIAQQQAQNELAQNNRLYQYNPQYPSGNWMFVPNGFQPSYSSFGSFSSGPYTPQLFGQQPMYNAGQSDQSAVTSGSWSLRPDSALQFSDPRMTPMTNLSPGNFGGTPSLLGNFGFDMSQQSFGQSQMQGAPFQQGQLSPSQMQPQLQQVPFSLPSTSPQLGGQQTWV